MKKKKTEKKIEKSKKEDVEYPRKLDMGGVNYIREDHIGNYIDSLPIEVQDQILMRGKPKKWWNPFSWWNKKESVDTTGNLLFLLDNEMGIKIYENVPSGIFKIKQYAGTDREQENFIVLKPNKLRTIRYEKEGKDGKKKEDFIRAWVADINNPNALPEDPMYDCEEVGNLVRKAVSGTNDFNNPKKDGSLGKWIKWIAIAGIVGYIIYLGITKYDIGSWFDFSSTKNLVSNAISTTPTNGSVPGGSLG